MDRPKRP